jgi:hypothetical protein
MRFEKYPVQCFSGSAVEFKSFISELIQQQIEKKKLEFMIKWEKNHEYEDKQSDEMIAYMDQNKNNILGFIENLDDPDATIQCSIAVNVFVKNKWEDN